MNERERAAGLAPTANYRYADVLGDRMYLAGQVPVDSSGTIVGAGDPAAQAGQCVDNLVAVVRANGFEVDDIHQLTVYVVGPHEHLIAAWREIDKRFGGEVPPATLLGVHLLGYHDQLVEIDARVERRRP